MKDTIFSLAMQLRDIEEKIILFFDQHQSCSVEDEACEQPEYLMMRETAREIEKRIAVHPAQTIDELLIKARLAEDSILGNLGRPCPEKYMEDIAIWHLVRDLERLAGAEQVRLPERMSRYFLDLMDGIPKRSRKAAAVAA